MKNKRSLLLKSGLLLTTGSLLLFSFSGVTREETPLQGGVTITLHVDTGNVDNKNTGETCDFGQQEGTNEEYTVVVNVGDVITWEGVSSTAPETDVVDITKIKYVKGTNIFGKDLLPGNRPHKISSKVLTSTATAGDYKYEISFTVTNNGVKRNGVFKIDPVIQAH
jgi:hypothetical protein